MLKETTIQNEKILVVEDDKQTQLLMALMLKKLGYANLYMASDGREAVDYLQNNKVDLVLMDLRMPLMDGFTATKIIRQEIDGTVPIIAVTAHAFDMVETECRAVGMNDFLRKPLSLHALETTIRRTLIEPS